MAPFAATVADLDADPYLLNVANGTLDLRTGQVRDHDPADRCSKVTAAAYRPEVDGAGWRAFLHRVLPDPEVRGFLQRLTGVALLGRVVEHVLPIATGVGANGKGVFTRSVEHALGDYASTAEADLFMSREGAHPTGEMDLLGRRWVTVSETDHGRRLAEATMKRLTGGDTVKARRMRQDFVEFGWDCHQGHDGPMALDRFQRDEAADLLRRVLAAVDRGEITTDGPAAATTVRRLEGVLLALETIGNTASGVGSTPS